MYNRLIKTTVSLFLVFIVLGGCGLSNNKSAEEKQNEILAPADTVVTDQNPEETQSDIIEENETEEIPEPEEINLINPSGETLESRISVPDGYERISAEESSFTTFLRNYRMLPDGSAILLYDGREKSNRNAVCVFDMYLSDRDLQQCADSIMRIYAEYMRSAGKDDKIAFHFVDGFLCDWNSYKSGKRIKVDGNDVIWVNSAEPSDSDEVFETYLNAVFAFSSTLSMQEECVPTELSDLKVGDVFIKGGSPGHVVMVADMCEKDGKKAFLLAQGYMPAQQFHVLRNHKHDGDPWYYEDEVTYPFVTPEYTFCEGSLMHPVYLD
ncbi:MAG: DUF4846 domain-containing protein [Lachnospiraceae bacterium]|nr:DUF4846 domain-containing protein [Lachnospiraceae bacterium]